ncbi:MAG TPA: Uma2 family endonuclease [Thermoanaerobaculia bacterium]|nr:Uma2 family endonuclease [Thermoanaerobaculia bacterium]
MAHSAHSLALPWNGDDRAWPAQGQWTYADYARLPDDGRRYEVIRGHLYVTPAPGFDHQYVISRLHLTFGRFVDENQLGIVLGAPFDVLLPDGIATPVQPDMVFLRTGNQPRSGDKNFQGVPDLVIEVESPSTRKRDRTIKLEAYRDAGVSEYWRLEPRPRTVTVLALSEDGSRYVEVASYGAGETVRSTVLSGLAISVDSLFPPV